MRRVALAYIYTLDSEEKVGLRLRRQQLPFLVRSFVAWQVYTRLVAGNHALEVAAPKLRARFIVHETLVHNLGVALELEAAATAAVAATAQPPGTSAAGQQLQKGVVEGT
jgi:hypothetical protein